MEGIGSMLDLQKTRARSLRFALIVLCVLMLETTITLRLRHPMPWVAVVPSLIPLLVTVFVVVPMKRATIRS